MPQVEKSIMDIFLEGIRARTNGDTTEAYPYPVAGRDQAAKRSIMAAFGGA
jgi:hypothetical protein